MYENASHCPAAWVVHRVEVASSHDEVFERIRAPDFDPLEKVVTEKPVDVQSGPDGNGEDLVRIVEYRPDRLDLSVTTGGNGMLLLSEIDYPRWRVLVNGKPETIHKVNGLLRGVLVPKGRSRVSFQYAPDSIRIGAYLTGVAFLGLVVLPTLAVVRKKVS